MKSRAHNTTKCLSGALLVLWLLTGCSNGSGVSATPKNSTGSGNRSTTTSSSRQHDSSYVTLWCVALDREKVPVGELVAVNEKDLAEYGCVTFEDPAGNAVVPPGTAGQSSTDGAGDLTGGGGTLYMVSSGVDRLAMDVLSHTDEKVVVELTVPGRDCVVTMEWRGDMVVVLQNVLPTTELEVKEIPDDSCGR